MRNYEDATKLAMTIVKDNQADFRRAEMSIDGETITIRLVTHTVINRLDTRPDRWAVYAEDNDAVLRYSIDYNNNDE